MIFTKYLSTSVGIYAIWIILHFIAPHFYIYFCTPKTIIGFISSPLVASAPHCIATRWVIKNGGDMITTMWIVIGGWFIQKIVEQKN
jgi:hypothetical protein